MSFLSGQAQDTSPISDQEWEELIVSLENEQFAAANERLTSMLKTLEEADIESDEPAILRYMYIWTVAGMLNERLYTKEEALEKVKSFEGQGLITPGRDVLGENCTLNCLQLEEDKPNTLFATATNGDGTIILAFERYEIEEGITKEELTQHTGKMGTIGGILESIEVEGNMFPRFRILIQEGVVFFD